MFPDDPARDPIFFGAQQAWQIDKYLEIFNSYISAVLTLATGWSAPYVKAIYAYCISEVCRTIIAAITVYYALGRFGSYTGIGGQEIVGSVCLLAYIYNQVVVSMKHSQKLKYYVLYGFGVVGILASIYAYTRPVKNARHCQHTTDNTDCPPCKEQLQRDRIGLAAGERRHSPTISPIVHFAYIFIAAFVLYMYGDNEAAIREDLQRLNFFTKIKDTAVMISNVVISVAKDVSPQKRHAAAPPDGEHKEKPIRKHSTDRVTDLLELPSDGGGDVEFADRLPRSEDILGAGEDFDELLAKMGPDQIDPAAPYKPVVFSYQGRAPVLTLYNVESQVLVASPLGKELNYARARGFPSVGSLVKWISTHTPSPRFVDWPTNPIQAGVLSYDGLAAGVEYSYALNDSPVVVVRSVYDEKHPMSRVHKGIPLGMKHFCGAHTTQAYKQHRIVSLAAMNKGEAFETFSCKVMMGSLIVPGSDSCPHCYKPPKRPRFARLTRWWDNTGKKWKDSAHALFTTRNVVKAIAVAIASTTIAYAAYKATSSSSVPEVEHRESRATQRQRRKGVAARNNARSWRCRNFTEGKRESNRFSRRGGLPADIEVTYKGKKFRVDENEVDLAWDDFIEYRNARRSGDFDAWDEDYYESKRSGGAAATFRVLELLDEIQYGGPMDVHEAQTEMRDLIRQDPAFEHMMYALAGRENVPYLRDNVARGLREALVNAGTQNKREEWNKGIFYLQGTVPIDGKPKVFTTFYTLSPTMNAQILVTARHGLTIPKPGAPHIELLPLEHQVGQKIKLFSADGTQIAPAEVLYVSDDVDDVAILSAPVAHCPGVKPFKLVETKQAMVFAPRIADDAIKLKEWSFGQATQELVQMNEGERLFKHTVDTNHGDSGCPIIRASTNEVVMMHIGNQVDNAGVPAGILLEHAKKAERRIKELKKPIASPGTVPRQLEFGYAPTNGTISTMIRHNQIGWVKEYDPKFDHAAMYTPRHKQARKERMSEPRYIEFCSTNPPPAIKQRFCPNVLTEENLRVAADKFRYTTRFHPELPNMQHSTVLLVELLRKAVSSKARMWTYSEACADVDPTTSVGYPYDKLWHNKGQALADPKLGELVSDYLLKLGTPDEKHEILTMNAKNGEIRLAEKKDKARVIFCDSVVRVVASKMLAGDIFDQFLAESKRSPSGNFWSALGLGPLKGGMNKLAMLLSHYECHSADGDAWETTQSYEAILTMGECIAEAWNLKGRHKEQFMALIRQEAESWVLDIEGHFFVKHGCNGSGNFLTSMLNTVFNMWVHIYGILCQRHYTTIDEMMLHFSMYLLGDDEILVNRVKFDRSAFYHAAYMAFGLTYTPGPEGDFTHHTFYNMNFHYDDEIKQWLPKLNCDKAHATLNSFTEPDKVGQRAYSIALLSYADSEWHDHFCKFLTFLGIQPPPKAVTLAIMTGKTSFFGYNNRLEESQWHRSLGKFYEPETYTWLGDFVPSTQLGDRPGYVSAAVRHSKQLETDFIKDFGEGAKQQLDDLYEVFMSKESERKYGRSSRIASGIAGAVAAPIVAGSAAIAGGLRAASRIKSRAPTLRGFKTTTARPQGRASRVRRARKAVRAVSALIGRRKARRNPIARSIRRGFKTRAAASSIARQFGDRMRGPPVALNRGLGPSKFSMSMSGTGRNQVALITGRDYLGTITNQDNTVGVSLLKDLFPSDGGGVLLNPESVGGARVAIAGNLFEQFRFRHISFTFTEASGTNTVGNVAGWVDPDPTDYVSSNEAGIKAGSTHMSFKTTPVWRECTWTADPKARNEEELWIRSSDVGDASLRLSNQGRFEMRLEVPTDKAPFTKIGSLHMNYILEMRKPTVNLPYYGSSDQYTFSLPTGNPPQSYAEVFNPASAGFTLQADTGNSGATEAFATTLNTGGGAHTHLANFYLPPGVWQINYNMLGVNVGDSDILGIGTKTMTYGLGAIVATTESLSDIIWDSVGTQYYGFQDLSLSAPDNNNVSYTSPAGVYWLNEAGTGAINALSGFNGTRIVVPANGQDFYLAFFPSAIASDVGGTVKAGVTKNTGSITLYTPSDTSTVKASVTFTLTFVRPTRAESLSLIPTQLTADPRFTSVDERLKYLESLVERAHPRGLAAASRAGAAAPPAPKSESKEPISDGEEPSEEVLKVAKQLSKLLVLD